MKLRYQSLICTIVGVSLFIIAVLVDESQAEEEEAPPEEAEDTPPAKPILKELATGKRIDVSGHANIQLLPTPQECGFSVSEDASEARTGLRIFLSRPTGLSNFPWVVRIVSEDTRGVRSPVCAGTFISSRYILTTATCLTGYNRGTKVSNVVLGAQSTNCEGGKCTPMSKILDVAETIVHPDYVAPTRQHDIGLVKLKADKLPGPETLIRPVCLPLSENLFENFKNNKTKAIGWSKFEEGSLASHLLYPRRLHATEMRFELRDYCDRFYTRSHAKFGPGRFCASGDVNKEICTDDEGGPVLKLINNPEIGHNRYYQLGIVSFQHSLCGQPGIPGGFTNVINYMPWILDHLSLD